MSEKPESLIPYDALVMNALRSVVREAIQVVSDTGLPGEHHFYLTFRTDHPLTEMPDTMRAKYPTEIRIVLQNQFSNLYVDDFGFHVTLYFGSVPTPFYVPFDAVTSFLDPHVQFSMRFDPQGMDAPAQAPAEDGGTAEDGGKDSGSTDEAKGETSGDGSGDGEDSTTPEGGNVVSLSAFRKP